MRRARAGRRWALACIAATGLGCGSIVTNTAATAPDAAVPDDRGRPPEDAGPAIDGAAGPDVARAEDLGGRPPEDLGGGGPVDRPDAGAPEAGVAEVGVGEVGIVEVPGSTCETATTVRDGDVLAGQTFPGRSDVPACRGSFARTSPTRWYRATVPASGVLEVTVSGASTGSIEMLALDACGASTCLERTAPGREVPPLIYTNAGATARTVLVAVVNLAPSPSPVTVSVRIRGASPNATCASATPLVAGVTLRGQDLGLSAENAVSCLDPADPGFPALFYTITVPPRTALIALAAGPTGARGPLYVDIRPPCAEAGCLPTAPNTRASAGGTSSQFNNASDAPRAVAVAVGTSRDAPRPVVDVSAGFRALPPNARCAAPAPLASGVALRVEHPEDATDATPRCPAAGDVPPRALYHEITVPPGQTLVASVAPADPGLASFGFVRLFAGCGGACLGAADAELGPSRAVYVNAAPGAQRVVVAVGATRASGAMPLDLRATLRPTAPNLDCAGAVALGPSSPARNVDLLEARQPEPCASGGPALYYAVQVPAGATLTVDATVDPALLAPASSQPTLTLIGGCGGVCLESSRPVGDARSTLTYVNRGASRTFVVALTYSTFGTDFAALVDLTARVE